MRVSARALSYIRSRATDAMNYRCTAVRVLSPGGYDDVTLVGTPPTYTTVIEDTECRIWEISPAAVLGVGETDLMLQTLQLSLPYGAPLLSKEDEIIITDAPVSDLSMLDKRFEVVSAAFAGDLRPTRRYQVKAMERR